MVARNKRGESIMLDRKEKVEICVLGQICKGTNCILDRRAHCENRVFDPRRSVENGCIYRRNRESCSLQKRGIYNKCILGHTKGNKNDLDHNKGDKNDSEYRWQAESSVLGRSENDESHISDQVKHSIDTNRAASCKALMRRLALFRKSGESMNPCTQHDQDWKNYQSQLILGPART